MSHFKRNALTKGATGSFGDEFVFRQINGKTVIAPLPKSSNVTTEKQAEIRRKFKKASSYAQSALSHPQMKEQYTAIAQQKRLKGGAAVAAMADFLSDAELDMVTAHVFDGSTGFLINIALTDNYKGKEMSVSIANKDGTIIESGQASFTFGEGAWKYITTATYQSLEDLNVLVTVKDRVGKVFALEMLLNS